MVRRDAGLVTRCQARGRGRARAAHRRRADPAGARTFLLDLPASVSPEVRDHLITTMEREREAAAEHLAADDLATLDRLDPAGLRQRPDVFLLQAQTVHFAVKE